MGQLWNDWGYCGRHDDISMLKDVKMMFFPFLQPFTENLPHAEIYELLSPDLLHQLIKGTFKDHLFTWIEEYLYLIHPKRRAKEILTLIDRRSVFQ